MDLVFLEFDCFEDQSRAKEGKGGVLKLLLGTTGRYNSGSSCRPGALIGREQAGTLDPGATDESDVALVVYFGGQLSVTPVKQLAGGAAAAHRRSCVQQSTVLDEISTKYFKSTRQTVGMATREPGIPLHVSARLLTVCIFAHPALPRSQ